MLLSAFAVIDFYNMQSNGRTGPKLVKLDYVRNIAKFSFHLHKSVTYLDLTQQEYSAYTDRFPFATKFYQKFVCSEQGLQKHLRPLKELEKTVLLQIYHLDVSKDREPVTENVEYRTINRNRIYDCATVYDIIPEKYFYERYMADYIVTALEKNTDKSSIVKLCLKFLQDKDFHHFFIQPLCRQRFIVHLLKYCSDSELVINVFKMLNFDTWITSQSEPDQLEIFLYHVNAIKEVGKMLCKNMIYMCFANSRYENVEILLEYLNFPELSCTSYEFAFYRLMSKRTEFNSEESENFKNATENNFQAVLTFLAFIEEPETFDTAFQALQLLWRSIPICFITLDEFKCIFGPIVDPREIKDVYNFYTDVIEQQVPSRQPRMLKHYCRVKIRTALSKQERLHDGIDELGLPLDLQLYLKLEN